MPLRTECCLAPINEPHYEYCGANVDVDKIDASFMQDKDRWVESYVHMSTSAVRRRVLGASNGHGH